MGTLNLLCRRTAIHLLHHRSVWRSDFYHYHDHPPGHRDSTQLPDLWTPGRRDGILGNFDSIFGTGTEDKQHVPDQEAKSAGGSKALSDNKNVQKLQSFLV